MTSPPTIESTVRILGVISSPRDIAPLDVDAEKARVEKALEKTIQLGRVELDWLDPATPRGLREACEHNIRKTDYAVTQIQSRTSRKVLFPSQRFNEFVVQLQSDGEDVIQRLLQKNIVPGFHLGQAYPELGNALLVCVTETTTRQQIDALVEGLK